VYKIEKHGKISLRRPKLSKEEVKRLMKKKKKKIFTIANKMEGPDFSRSAG